MFGFGKTSQNAIAAMSFLAEHYDGGKHLVSSVDIAEARRLPKPIVAKILTILSQAGFVKGAPGPGGGYTLAVAPDSISLHAVVSRFERPGTPILCPFGADWCGNGTPCPLHDSIVELGDSLGRFLHENHFGMFRAENFASRSQSAAPAST